MKKINSLIYLTYYLLLWVILPSTIFVGGGVKSDLSSENTYSVSAVEFNIYEVQQFVNSESNSLNTHSSSPNWLTDTGHWPVVFSSIINPDFGFDKISYLKTGFSTAPKLGALTVSKLIFPFHYFW